MRLTAQAWSSLSVLDIGMWALSASMSLLVLAPTSSPRLRPWYAAHRRAVVVLVRSMRALVWGYTMRQSHVELLLNSGAGFESWSALREAASKVGRCRAQLRRPG